MTESSADRQSRLEYERWVRDYYDDMRRWERRRAEMEREMREIVESGKAWWVLW